MKKILLIDVDSTIPNIPLMKLSTWHKEQGDNVSLVRLNLSYYPVRKKEVFSCPSGYDKVYASAIFEGTKEYVIGQDIIFGGTGHDLTTTLPEEVEKCECDYLLYPDNDISYGFLTRGCIRGCYFCKVPKKEGYIRKVAEISDIVRHKKVKFLDNNILAYPGHKDILAELVDRELRCQFNQGLDIRLLDEENSSLLGQMNYLGEYFFAFDDWGLLPVIEKKLPLLSWRKDYQLKFFTYVHPDMSLSNIIKRVKWLREHKLLPYVMRDISCWGSQHSDFYTDLAAYTNQAHLFKKMDFKEFLAKRHVKQERIAESLRVWERGA